MPCNGSDEPRMVTITCSACVGTGSIESSDSTDDSWWDCSLCKGTGKRTIPDRRKADAPAVREKAEAFDVLAADVQESAYRLLAVRRAHAETPALPGSERPCSTCGGRGWHTAGGNDPMACGRCPAGEAWYADAQPGEE